MSHTPKIQWSCRHRAIATETPTQKVGNGIHKGVTAHSNSEIQQRECCKLIPLFSRPRNNSPGLWALFCRLFHPLSHPYFFKKGSTCLWLNNFLSLLPASRILEVQAFHSVLSLSLSIQASSVSVYIVFSKTLWDFCAIHWGSHH